MLTLKNLRRCAGRLKALTEASYVIVRLTQDFSHIESEDKRAWIGQVQLTAKNADGCKFALRPVLYKHCRLYCRIEELLKIETNMQEKRLALELLLLNLLNLRLWRNPGLL